MSKPRWGSKRRCTECGTAFYDMQRTPIACPKCNAVHTPVTLLKSIPRPARKSRYAPVAQAVAEPAPTNDNSAAGEEADSDAEAIEANDNDDSDNVSALDEEREDADEREELT